MMRLAFCVRAFYPQHGFGGLERAATAQVRHLLAQGVALSLYTQPFPPGQPFHSALSTQHSALRVRPIAYGGLPLRANGIPARLTNYRLFVKKMGNRVRAEALRGRLHGAYGHGLCAYGLRHAGEWGLPLVANPHGLEEFKMRDPLKRLAYAPFRAWVRAGCRAADRVVATDHAMRDEVARLLAIDPARVVVIPSGVDVDELLVYVTEAGQREIVGRWPQLEPARAPFVGISVGRMEANKGFSYLLEALHTIASGLEEGWVWLFVGEGTMRDELQVQASALGLSEHIVFTGSVSDAALHNLYARADLFAHPSLFEGSSLVTLEAMAHSLPVVATRVGGIPDKLTHGETGFLVEPGQPRRLAEHILTLARDPHWRAEMGRRGAEKVACEFSWASGMERLVAVFNEVAHEKAACHVQEL